MREFDTLRAVIPPLIVVPGTTTINLSNGTAGVLGDKAVGQDYNIHKNN